MSETDRSDGNTESIRDYGTSPNHSRAPTEQEDEFVVTGSVTSESSSDEDQAGVKAIEAIARTWSPWSLVIAYIGIALIAICTSLEQNTTTNLTVIVTSYFGHQALISSVTLVQGVILGTGSQNVFGVRGLHVPAVVKPTMAKIADVFGRLEAFSFSVVLYTIGYIQQAAANNVKTFAGAQIFYSAGQTGLQILVQIFIADTTNLTWRAFFSSVVDIPFLFTVWVGPVIAGSFRSHTSWRWGYGIWAIVLPVAFLPLSVSLFITQRKASRRGALKKSPYQGQTLSTVLRRLCLELDFFGLLLLSAGVSLVLLPLTLAPEARSGWHNTSMIAMLVVGGICVCAFAVWERSPQLAPHAFFPRDLFQQRTVVVGVAWAFWYYMAFYLSVQPYFQSYLLVVQDLSLTAAGHVIQVFSFTSSITAVTIGLIIRLTGHYKYFVTLGSCIYLLGVGLMIKYRTRNATLGALVSTQIAVGIGGGMANVPAQVGIQASANHQQVAAATAVYLTMLEIGGAVGSAISGAVWSGNILSKLRRYLPEDSRDQATAIYSSVMTASARYPKGTPERAAIDRAYQETMQILLVVALYVSFIPIILSFFMKDYKLNQMDQKVEGLVIGGDEHTSGASEARPLNAARHRRAGTRRSVGLSGRVEDEAGNQDLSFGY